MSWSSPPHGAVRICPTRRWPRLPTVCSATPHGRGRQSHMAGCAECSDAVYGQRAARAALRSALQPRLPAGLFERLRELPITAELPLIQCPAALSADGPAVVRFGWSGSSPVPAETPSGVRSIEGFPDAGAVRSANALAAEAAHRRASARVGLGATAIAVLADGMLATTAANAGGVTPLTNTVQRGVSGHDLGRVHAGPMETARLLGGPSDANGPAERFVRRPLPTVRSGLLNW